MGRGTSISTFNRTQDLGLPGGSKRCSKMVGGEKFYKRGKIEKRRRDVEYYILRTVAGKGGGPVEKNYELLDEHW